MKVFYFLLVVGGMALIIWAMFLLADEMNGIPEPTRIPETVLVTPVPEPTRTPEPTQTHIIPNWDIQTTSIPKRDMLWRSTP